jgi:YD repeat-containing protein
MVAIFTGAGTGFERSSASVLGTQGRLGDAKLGRGGESVFVNAATGNLVISQRDEFLVGRGPDVSIGRTYNSLAMLGDDNNDRWRQSTDRRVFGLTGTLNTPGSTVRRVGDDGAEIVYTWDGARGAYVATDGAGSYDQITRSGSLWTWTDGDSQTVEKYDETLGGRIVQAIDSSGNALSFTYISGKLDKVTTADGSWTQYLWSGNNITRIVTGFTNLANGASTTLSRTWYEYSGNRLTKVRVDLTPNDHTLPSDSDSYWTSYGYDAAGRVNSITQKDGSSLTITYDAAGRVETLTELVSAGVTRTTTLGYGAGYTNVTDATGQVTRLDYAPAANLAAPLHQWGSGNVAGQAATMADGTAATLYTATAAGWAGIYSGLSVNAGDTVTFGLTLQAVGGVTSQALGLYGSDGWGQNGVSFARIVSGPGQLVQTAGGLWTVTGLSASQATRIEVTRTYRVADWAGAYIYVDYPGGFRSGIQMLAADATLMKSATATDVALTNINNWYHGGVNKTAVGTIDGDTAYKYTVQTAGGWAGVYSGLYAAKGDTYSFSLSFQASDGYTAQSFGLYGNSSGWGNASGSTARIVSGPGYVTQAAGGLWTVSGLSATQVTRVEIVRTYEQDESGGAYIYSDLPGNFRVGASLIVAAAHVTKRIVEAPTAQQLVKITAPPAQSGAAQQTVQFGYNGKGDLISVTDAAGQTTGYSYDSKGNMLTATNRLGQTVTRTYGSKNELLSETRIGSDNSGAAVSHTHRYVYDSANRLRYAITASGMVTEYRYTGTGELWLTIEYPKHNYNGAAVWTEAQMNSWRDGLADKSSTRITLNSYDARGNLTSVLNYGAAAPDGSPSTNEGYSRAFYTYDQAGRLLSRNSEGENAETFVYDGAGRVVASTDVNGGTTTVVFNDAATTTTVTMASGYVSTSTYNRAGDLISQTDGGSYVAGGTSSFKYDKLGRLRMSTDATGFNNYYLYDKVGRKVADINHYGDVIEYRYDANDRLVATARFTNRLSAGQISALANPDHGMDMASLRPPAHSYDVWSFSVFNVEGERIAAIGGDGSVTTYAYDASGRLVTTTAYANRLGAAHIDSFKAYGASLVLPPADSSRDSVARIFYDQDGNQIGVLDGNGYLSRSWYDRAGLLITQATYANPTNAALRASGTLDQLAASVGTSPSDRYACYVYDGQGLLRYTINALRQVTGYNYNTAGRRISTTLYAAPIPASNDISYATTKALVAPQVGSAANRTSFIVYDAAGREAYAIDPDGSVVGMTYDNQGRVTRRVGFAAKYVTGSLPALSTMSSWESANIGNAANRITRTWYTARGEARYTVDAEGYISRADYDAEGRLTAEYKWDNRVSVYDWTTIGGAEQATWGAGGYTGVTRSYRADGLVHMEYNGVGTPTLFDYYANGLLAARYDAYGTADQAITLFIYDAAGQLITKYGAYGTPEQNVTQYSYDGLGNQISMTDPRGKVTTSTYDNLGQLKTVTNALGHVISYEYNAFGEVWKNTTANGHSGYAWYDQLGRMTHELDAENYLTETTYTTFGEMASQTRRFNRFTSTPAIGTPPSVVANSAEDATFTYAYDKLGRQIQLTDAMGATESYGYDAFSNRVSVTNRLGLTTTYTYDRRGAMLTETLPVVTHDSAGNVTGYAVVNRFEYDARGNRTKTVEADNYAYRRTTTFVFNRADQMIQRIGDAVNVIGDDLVTVSTVQPVDTVAYDLRGNIIETRDAAGGRVLRYYDDLNRKTVEINAAGVYSAWSYDATGNVVSARTYANPVAHPANPGGTPPGAPGGGYRETSFGYDNIDRLTTSTVANVTYGYWNGSSYVISTDTATNTLTFDAWGNIIVATDPNGAQVFYWYDKLGRQTAMLDAQGYLTTATYDPDGNVVSERRWANRFTGTPTPGGSPPAVSASADDRITDLAYDKNGRRLSETRYNVVAHTVDAGSGALYAAASAATVSYLYNALGQVVRKTEATGEITQYAYDGLGRLTTETRAAFVDFNGQWVAPTVDYYYDGLENVTRMRQRGATGAAERVATSNYGAGGRLVSSTDANGFTRYFDYDILGRVKKESYTRTRSDGSTSTDAVATRYDLMGRSVYRGIATQSGGGFATLDYSQTEYNAFGEVSRQGSNGLWQVSNVYDNVGRLLATNSGDGVWKYFGYDRTGNQTVAVTSAGYDMPSYLSLSGAVSLIGSADVNGTYTVYDNRSLATQVVEEGRQLSASAAQTLVTNRSYNAFREVVSETNALGATLNYTYNTLGKRIRIESPWVSITLENGANQTVRPTENYYYDLGGRLIGGRDANDNLTTRTLLAGTGYASGEGVVAVEFSPDGGRKTARHDVHGDARVLIDQIGRTTSQTFDAMGRVTQISRPNGLVEGFAYDGLGQRIQHWNNVYQTPIYGPPEQVWVQDGYWDPYYGWVDTSHWETHYPIVGYTPEKERTDYDALGRVTLDVTFGGDTTTTAYSWNGGLATSGLGTFGGWTNTVTYANGRTMTVSQDIYGRETSKTDLGGHVFYSSYDKGGRLASRGDQNYVYLNTGHIGEVYTATGVIGSLNWSKKSAKYGYDAVGNRTSEYTLDEGRSYSEYWDPYYGYQVNDYSWSNVYQNATATYDALGRLTSYNEWGGINVPAASMSYAYDANGNIRRSVATYRTLDNNGNASGYTSTQDQWYRFDSMNRVVTKGTLSAGQIVRGNGGIDYLYNQAGERIRATRTTTAWATIYDPYGWDPYYGGSQYMTVPYDAETREDYTYDAGGNLSAVYVAQSGYYDNWDGTLTVTPPPATGDLKGSYTYDTMGRLTRQIDWLYNGSNAGYDRTVTYNGKGQIASETVVTKRGSETHTNYINNDYGYGSNYALGSAVYTSSSNYKNGAYQNYTSTSTTYAWWDGAVQSTVSTTQGTTANSTYYYDGNGRVTSIYVGGARPRSITFTNDMNGQVIRRDESDNNWSQGDPHEVWYRFNGKQMGYTGNDGTLDTDYQTSIGNRTRTPGTGAFKFGSTWGSAHADFDLSLDPINSYNQGSVGNSYTVRTGDTLPGIAAQLWGDSSLWYRLAEANGMTAANALVEGQRLIVPSGVMKSQHNASTFKPYNPSEVLGDTSPVTTQPRTQAKKGGKCGIFGQILLAVIAVAITVVLPIAAPATFGGVWGGIGAAVIGNVVSQGVGVATGIQDKFSWKSVALAAISAGVSGGIGADGLDLFGKINSKVLQGALNGAVSSAVSQGIGVATGLQDKFDWVGVAAAGVGGGVGAWAAGKTQGWNKYASKIATTGASALAQAATRSVLEGTSFGVNLVAALPSTIAAMVGGVLDIALGGPELRAAQAAAKAARALEADKSARLQDGACFVAGTLVHTPDGLVPIESIDVGDWVYAKQEGFDGGEVHRRQITHTYIHHDKRTITVAFEQAGREVDRITATAEHPFHVAGRGWVHTENLSVGDQVLLIDGARATVSEVVEDETTSTVYNFTVDVDHTYFVGNVGLWVHNGYWTNDGRWIETENVDMGRRLRMLNPRVRIPHDILPRGSNERNISYWQFERGSAYRIYINGVEHYFDPRLFQQRVVDNIALMQKNGGQLTPQLQEQIDFNNRVAQTRGMGPRIDASTLTPAPAPVAPTNPTPAPVVDVAPSLPPPTAPTLSVPPTPTTVDITPADTSQPGGLTLPDLTGPLMGATRGGPAAAPLVIDWRFPGREIGKTPINNGTWVGGEQNRGNGIFRTAYGDIPYRNNYADFSRYSILDVPVDGLNGEPGPHNKYTHDKRLAYKHMAENMGMGDEIRATRNGHYDRSGEAWARRNGVRFHHAPDGRSIQFVPNDIHNFNHYGGGHHLRNTTPFQRSFLRGIGTGGRYLGYAGMAYGVYEDGGRLLNEFQISRTTGNYSNTAWEGARIGTAWTAAAAGASLGAKIGAWGFAGGPIVGGITTLLGGAIGGGIGYFLGESAINALH